MAAYVDEASPHEVTLIGKTLAARFEQALPQRMIGDRVCDSDPLGAEIATQGVEMISPHCENRSRASDTGRAAPAPLQEEVEGRAAQRLAPELPPTS